ncbi:MAG: stage III sporulation protein AB [Desulfitobacterium hafniense]|nr:stage III sporulation protein AB [Desulfitobacterium hafniense]
MLVFASICLVVGSGGLGLIIANRIRKRPVELRQFLTALALLDTEILWGRTPLPEAFANLKERTDDSWRDFFGELEERLKRGEAAGYAWNQTIKSLDRSFCLKPEDWQVIRDIGKGLGRSDRQEQHKQIQLVQQQVSLLKEQVSTWAEKQAKMWSYLGFMSGIAAVIFLI